MSNWLKYKKDWVKALDAAKVKNPDARKLCLKFWRKINTLQNMMERSSWGRVQSSKEFDQAGDLAIEIERKYFKEYNRALKARNFVVDKRGVNISNLLA